MERSPDKRIQITKRLLAEQLVRSAEEKDLDEITIKDLCAKAGVSRVTFYKYYSSINELMEETAENAMKEVIPDEHSAGEPEQLVRRLLLNKPLYLLLIEKGYCEDSIKTWLRRSAVRGNLPEPQQNILAAQMEYAVSGLCGLLRYCLEKEPDLSVRQLTDIILRFHESWTQNVHETINL
jgi:AcrR family transcriptional regulator